MKKTIRKDFNVVRRHIERIMPLVIHAPSGWLPYRWLSPSWGPPYNVCQFVWDAFHQCLRYLRGRPLYAPQFASWNLLADVMYEELGRRSSPLLDALR